MQRLTSLNKTLVPVTRQLVAPTRTFFSRRSPWGLMDISRQMGEMNKLFSQLEHEMNSAFRSPGFGSLPSRFRNLLEPTSQYVAVTPTIEADVKASGENGTQKYVLKLDVGPDYNPEDIKVSLKDRVLTVYAKLEQKSEDGNSRLFQEVSRSFTLPDGVNLEEVKSLLTPEGFLTIEAPLPEIEAPKPKEIPISVESQKPAT